MNKGTQGGTGSTGNYLVCHLVLVRTLVKGVKHGCSGRSGGTVGDTLEETGRPAKIPLDICSHFCRGVDFKRVTARPGDVFQQ